MSAPNAGTGSTRTTAIPPARNVKPITSHKEMLLLCMIITALVVSRAKVKLMEILLLLSSSGLQPYTLSVLKLYVVLAAFLASLMLKLAGGDRANGLFSKIARRLGGHLARLAPGRGRSSLRALLKDCQAGIRTLFTDAWVKEVAGRWDQAIAGNSFPRVALLRAFCDKCLFFADEAKALFTSSASWDIKGFYDILQIEQILKEGLGLGAAGQLLAA